MPPLLALFALDIVPSLTALGLVLIMPAEGRKFLRCASAVLTRLSARPWLSLWLVAVLVLLACLGFSFFLGIPEPRVHDEFSYLLAADTFLHGRLSNPTHAMWQHFETFHVIHQPTYASKFFPAQGLSLAVGRLIGGHPIVGVWLSVAGASMALCWMLRAYVPPRWALVGTILALVQVRLAIPIGMNGLWGYWSQSYWAAR